MGARTKNMSLLPYGYSRGYGYPGTYGYPYGGAYPYGPYGMTAEEIGKIREAEEKAFAEAEAKRKEFMDARRRSTTTSSARRRRSTRTTLLPRRRLSRMPSQRRRSL